MSTQTKPPPQAASNSPSTAIPRSVKSSASCRSSTESSGKYERSHFVKIFIQVYSPSLIFLPICSRHNAFHEFIEQRHSKCRLSMARAPYHSLENQILPNRSKRSHCLT